MITRVGNSHKRVNKSNGSQTVNKGQMTISSQWPNGHWAPKRPFEGSKRPFGSKGPFGPLVSKQPFGSKGPFGPLVFRPLFSGSMSFIFRFSRLFPLGFSLCTSSNSRSVSIPRARSSLTLPFSQYIKKNPHV